MKNFTSLEENRKKLIQILTFLVENSIQISDSSEKVLRKYILFTVQTLNTTEYETWHEKIVKVH